MQLEFLSVIFGAYFLGSIPFGYILAKMKGMGDIRKLGSGNIGATNVLRTGTKAMAFFTLLGDIGKGIIAVVLARYFYPDLTFLAGFMAVIGHLYPIWLKFKGGKGVATGIGVYVAIAPLAGLCVIGIWLLVLALTRYASVASMLAFLGAPFVFWGFGVENSVYLSFILAGLIVVKHLSNIQRLLKGQETKVGAKK